LALVLLLALGYFTTPGEAAPLVVAASGVLSNDLDGDWDSLVAAGIAVAPVGGAVSLDADGSFVYTPDADFTGTDTFTYTVSDHNGGFDTATVTVTVSENDHQIYLPLLLRFVSSPTQ
jgi:hypothetical protein